MYIYSLFNQRLWSEDERPSVCASNSEVIDKIQERAMPRKNRAASASVEEEITTDWIPEIPFENVC